MHIIYVCKKNVLLLWAVYLVAEMPGVVTVQLPVSDTSEEGQTEQKEAPAPKPVVEIIYPPPEVRSILLLRLVWWCAINRILINVLL